MTAIPTTIPHGRTAQRLTWPHLPPARARPGRGALRVAGGGRRLPGRRLHARLRLGAHLRGRLEALRQGGVGEGAADVRRLLPRGGPQAPGAPASVPAPRLLWVARRRLGGARDRVRRGPRAAAPVAAGRPRRRPRRARGRGPRADARAGRARTWTPFADELAGWPAYWDHVAATRPDLPHLAEAAALAAGFADGDRAATPSCTPTSATTTCCSGPTAPRCSATGTGRSRAPPGSTRCSC